MVDISPGEGWYVVANPADKEKLRALGANVDVVRDMDWEARIDFLFSVERQQEAKSLGPDLPKIPQLAAPEILSLYREITDCVLAGAYGAAITMSTILAEFALKYTTFICEVGEHGRDDPDKWDEFESLTFAPAAKRARSAGLITDKQFEKLNNFRDQIRNPYAHYNIRKITRGNVWKNVMVYNRETGETEIRDIAAEDSPVIRAQIKPHFDRANVVIVFGIVDEIVRSLFDQMEGIIGSKTEK